MANKTGEDLVEEAKQQIDEVTPEQVREMQARDERVVYHVVREPNEWNLGRLPHAVHLPRGNLETKVEGMIEWQSSNGARCLSGFGFRHCFVIPHSCFVIFFIPPGARSSDRPWWRDARG